MGCKIAFLMDDIQSTNPLKDTSLYLANLCQQQAHIFYVHSSSLFFQRRVMLLAQPVTIDYQGSPVYQLGPSQRLPASDFDIIYLRSDPPFDDNYLYRTQLLSLAVNEGVRVVNNPDAVRDFNEKLLILQFLPVTTEVIVTANISQLKQFLQQHQKIVVKPLNSMGGDSIFVVQQDDPNTNVILETITLFGKRTIMAQRYLDEISQGDKRILLINGEPSEYCLARIPKPGESRGNLAAGGEGVVQPTSSKNLQIARSVGAFCRQQGLFFVGLDLIGDKLTEINVTSPTCLKEIDTYMQGQLGQRFLAMQEQWL